MLSLSLPSSFRKRISIHKSMNKRSLGFMYYISHNVDFPGRKENQLDFYLNGKTLSIKLPQFFKPAIVQRPNREPVIMDRLYGVYVNGCRLYTNYGIINYYDHAGVKSKSANFTLPWKQPVTTGLCMMDLTNSHPAIEFIGSGMTYSEYREKQEASPALEFTVKDYDGEEAKMFVRVERHTSTKGTGWCKWTRWFRKPVVKTSLLIEFSKYLGTQKHSWKGGSKSASVELLKGETVEEGIQRFLLLPANFNFEFGNITLV